MLRKLLIVGVFAGASASVPMILESSPGTLDAASWTRASEDRSDISLAKATSGPSGARTLTGKRVEVPMNDRGHFVAEFRINGRKVDAMVDTGATLVAINLSTARKLGINLTRDDFRHTVGTANGTVKAAATRLDDVKIGRIHLDGVDAVVLEDTALDATLVGMSFLKRLKTFNVAQGAMVLEQ